MLIGVAATLAVLVSVLPSPADAFSAQVPAGVSAQLDHAALVVATVVTWTLVAWLAGVLILWLAAHTLLRGRRRNVVITRLAQLLLPKTLRGIVITAVGVGAMAAMAGCAPGAAADTPIATSPGSTSGTAPGLTVDLDWPVDPPLATAPDPVTEPPPPPPSLVPTASITSAAPDTMTEPPPPLSVAKGSITSPTPDSPPPPPAGVASTTAADAPDAADERPTTSAGTPSAEVAGSPATADVAEAAPKAATTTAESGVLGTVQAPTADDGTAADPTDLPSASAPPAAEPAPPPGATPPGAATDGSASPPSAPSAPASPFSTVTVVAGDSLWSLAAAHLPADATDVDVALAWPHWYASNQALIGDDPGHIEPGWQLTIPSDREDLPS